MRCYLLTGFVFVFSLMLAKGHNVPLSLSYLLVPKTKYDYDITRFFFGIKESGTSEVINEYKDSTKAFDSHLETTEAHIRKEEQLHQDYPIHFGSQFNPYEHRKEHVRDHFGVHKPFYIRFHHDTPKRPYRPIFQPQNKENGQTGFVSTFSSSQNNYFPTTIAPASYLSPIYLPPAPPAPMIPPTPQKIHTNLFGPDTTKQVENGEVLNRFGENVQQEHTTKSYYGASFGAFANATSTTETSNKNFQQSYHSFNGNDYKAPTTAAPVSDKPAETSTTTTTIKPSQIILLTSLADDKSDVKYKETETDYYDFDEEDLKRPQYDITASRKLFEEFVKKYKKSYKDKQDEEVHYQNFIKSLMTVNRLNAEGGSASFDINILSDEDRLLLASIG